MVSVTILYSHEFGVSSSLLTTHSKKYNDYVELCMVLSFLPIMLKALEVLWKLLCLDSIAY